MPPLPGSAVNDVNWPAHMGLLPELITTETVAGAIELTVRTTAALAVMLGEAHTDGLVKTQIMLEAFEIELLLNVEVFVPTFIVLTLH